MNLKKPSPEAMPRDRWLDLRSRILAEIKEIDNATQWSAAEPKWWLEMQSVRSVTLAAKS